MLKNKIILMLIMGILIINKINKIKIKENLRFFKGKELRLDDLSIDIKKLSDFCENL
jgi:hypothetical protein